MPDANTILEVKLPFADDHRYLDRTIASTENAIDAAIICDAYFRRYAEPFMIVSLQDDSRSRHITVMNTKGVEHNAMMIAEKLLCRPSPRPGT